MARLAAAARRCGPGEVAGRGAGVRAVPSRSQSCFRNGSNIPATINVTTMLASFHRGLVATPRTANQFNLPMGHLPDSWKMGMDLGFMNWKKDIEAYRWVYQKIG